jgi:hypothetical protein
VKEVFQAELKLLSEKVLMQLLATQGLLAEEEMGSPLLGLMSLHDQQVIGPLEDLMVLVGLGNSSLENLLLLFEPFFHLPVAWWVISSNSTKTWSWWCTPEVLHKNHEVGGCSTFF